MSPQSILPDWLATGTHIEVFTRQTTYWDVVVNPDGSRCRIHFRNKVEFEFSGSPADKIALRSNHPLLIDYEEPNDALYISSKPTDPHATLGALHELSERHFRGWRPLTHYLNDLSTPEEIFSSGHGLLLRGPRSFTAAVADFLSGLGVQLEVHQGSAARGTFQVLELGKSYVVAEHFDFELISHAA